MRAARRAAAVFGSGLLYLLAASVPAAAVKTDILVLQNGDRITGEVKQLLGGRLTYKTDDMGTLSVEWLKVAELTSTTDYEVETEDARRFVGRIEPLGPSTLVVVGDPDLHVVGIEEVVRITRLDAGFWRRLEGSFDLGLSYTQADQHELSSTSISRPSSADRTGRPRST